MNHLDVYDLLIVTFLLFLPVLNHPLPLELFVYLRLIIGILSLCTFAHVTVLSLSNPALNLTFSLLPITSSHPHASASDSTLHYWRYINIYWHWHWHWQRTIVCCRTVESVISLLRRLSVTVTHATAACPVAARGVIAAVQHWRHSTVIHAARPPHHCVPHFTRLQRLMLQRQQRRQIRQQHRPVITTEVDI